MKTILGLCLVLGLTHAMPIKDSQDNQTHLSQVQLEDLIWSLEADRVLTELPITEQDSPLINH